MHQKKIPRVKNILHSIPILRKKVYSKKNSSSLSSFLNNRSIVIKNKHLRYVSSSIPLCCIVALLLLSICIISPSSNPFISHADVYAEESVEESVEESNTSTRSAEEPDPVATLNITGDLTQTNNIGPNQTVYRTHGIKVNLQDVTDYTLQVSYANGSNGLVYEGTNTGNNTITGANNIQGSSLNTNTWGYAWSDNDKEDDANLYYQTMPSYGSASSGILKNESATGSDEVLTKTVNGKLVFAAKFADDAPYGHYKTSVLLSLAATPKKVVADTNTPVDNWNDLEYMQQMSAKACENAVAEEGKTYATKELIDSRDGNTYTIAKLEDGRCWMTTNLRLTGDSLTNNGHSVTISSEDSNVKTDYSVPTTSDPWDTPNNPSMEELNKQLIYYGGKTEWGALYTWCTITAGSCTEATAKDDTVSASICPKGWRLQTKSEYDSLTAQGVKWETINNSAGSTIGGGFFPAAGYVNSGSTGSFNEEGFYWSSTAMDDKSVYDLYLHKMGASANGFFGGRYYGLSGRCIAQTAEDEKADSFPSTLITMQDMSSEICDGVKRGTSKSLKDSRDGNSYTITKLDDDKCWMTENLKLDISKANLLSGTDTDLSSEAATWPSKNLPATGFNINLVGPVWNNGTGVNNSAQWKDEYGYYYNWCAATAGSCSGATNNNDIASASICPKSWKLPNKNDYLNLISNDDGWDSTLKGEKLAGGFFPATGYMYNGDLEYSSACGNYWSSTGASGNFASGLYFDSNGASINVSGGGTRSYGFSIRCVAE